jgi:RNA polymerase sigma-70 factor, ECF subfamily
VIDPFGTPAPSLRSVEAFAHDTHPDHARVQRALGSDAALEELLAALLPRVRNLVRYLVRADEVVDDIAQEGLFAVARGLSTYRGEGSLESWADRVVARCTFAAIARGRHDRARSTVDAAVLATIPAPEAGPEELAIRRSVVRLLDELPDPQRQALVLHHVVGMSIQEIARDTHTPLETVRSRLRLGAARFRELSRAADGDQEEK